MNPAWLAAIETLIKEARELAESDFGEFNFKVEGVREALAALNTTDSTVGMVPFPLVRAAIETRHFSFEAVGLTGAAALVALRAGLVRHAESHRLRMDGAALEGWLDSMVMDPKITTLTAGKVLRDGEEI